MATNCRLLGRCNKLAKRNRENAQTKCVWRNGRSGECFCEVVPRSRATRKQPPNFLFADHPDTTSSPNSMVLVETDFLRRSRPPMVNSTRCAVFYGYCYWSRQSAPRASRMRPNCCERLGPLEKAHGVGGRKLSKRHRCPALV